MEYKKAISLMEQHIYDAKHNGGTYEGEMSEALTIGISALEYRTPQKIKNQHDNYYCPTCNACFISVTDGYVMDWQAHLKKWQKVDIPGLHGTTPYCGNCGQKLEWSL